MPYYFECDNCHEQVEISGGGDFRKVKTCKECGQDCCQYCIMENRLCGDCFGDYLDKPEGAEDD